MASINKAILIGHLGKDPETRYIPNGDAICNLSLATSESWKDKATGEKKEQTEWHRVVLFRSLAEIADKYLKKGALIYIEGAIKTRKWQDKQGNDRYSTEIQASELKMLGGKGNDTQKHSSAPAESAAGGSAFDSMADDVPF